MGIWRLGAVSDEFNLTYFKMVINRQAGRQADRQVLGQAAESEEGGRRDAHTEPSSFLSLVCNYYCTNNTKKEVWIIVSVL